MAIGLVFIPTKPVPYCIVPVRYGTARYGTRARFKSPQVSRDHFSNLVIRKRPLRAVGRVEGYTMYMSGGTKLRMSIESTVHNLSTFRHPEYQTTPESLIQSVENGALSSFQLFILWHTISAHATLLLQALVLSRRWDLAEWLVKFWEEYLELPELAHFALRLFHAPRGWNSIDRKSVV